MDGAYAAALDAERARYEHCVHVHDLPDIFHYWSNTHLLPTFRAFGFESATEMFLQQLRGQCASNARARIVSLGAGNCDLEVELCSGLVAAGHADFTLECIDLNATMLRRGEEAARAAGVAQRMRFVEADLNAWIANGTYHAVIANQSLHHIVQLEAVFDAVRRSLAPGGCFAVSDMIGRNGHQRWPEALEIVNQFWRELPPSYRFNQQLRRFEESFQDWDCSATDFEGIRSQDILPLLIDRFHFQLFVPYGNAIDPFVDRNFGPNFDAQGEWDRNFIDRVHHRDEAEMRAGNLEPTHMLAVLVWMRNARLSIRRVYRPRSACATRSVRSLRRPSHPNPISGTDGRTIHCASYSESAVCFPKCTRFCRLS